MTPPLVSVVMGVYNGAARLAETIDSILDQTLQDFEIIVINDGSTDSYVRVLLNSYSQSNSRINIIDKENTGLTCALVDGCEQANGEFIARIDVGDKMQPQRLQKQTEVLARYSKCELVTSDVGFYSPEWDLLWVLEGKPQTESPVSVVSNKNQDFDCDIPHHGSVMFRKSTYHKVGGYRKAFYYGQDWDLWYRLLEQGEYYAISAVLYQARYFPDAISMRYSDRQSRIAKCSLDGHLARRRGEPEEAFLELAASIRPQAQTSSKNTSADGYYFIGEALRRSGHSTSRQYLLKAIKHNPIHWQSYIRLIQSLAIRG